MVMLARVFGEIKAFFLSFLDAQYVLERGTMTAKGSNDICERSRLGSRRNGRGRFRRVCAIAGG
jgi:hypothetical protein